VDKLALSITKAAELADVCKSLLYREIAEGKGPRTFLIGTAQRVLVSDLRAWMEARAALPNSPKPRRKRKPKSNGHALAPPPAMASAA
jgi:predicted DNA-binding transcriptional regulator AlpA